VLCGHGQRQGIMAGNANDGLSAEQGARFCYGHVFLPQMDAIRAYGGSQMGIVVNQQHGMV
jgi:hypothetical protein